MIKARSHGQIMLLTLVTSGLALVAGVFVYVGAFVLEQMPSKHSVPAISSSAATPLVSGAPSSSIRTIAALPSNQNSASNNGQSDLSTATSTWGGQNTSISGDADTGIKRAFSSTSGTKNSPKIRLNIRKSLIENVRQGFRL